MTAGGGDGGVSSARMAAAADVRLGTGRQALFAVGVRGDGSRNCELN